jgi:hypothetical protein
MSDINILRNIGNRLREGKTMRKHEINLLDNQKHIDAEKVEMLHKANIANIRKKMAAGKTLNDVEIACLESEGAPGESTKAKTRASQIRDAMRRKRSEDSDLTIKPYEISPRRRRAEKSLKAFCKTYLKHMFPLPSSQDQEESIKKIEIATLSGGSYAQAAPRGDGKTQRSKAGVLWASLSGHAHYIAAIAATGKLGKRLIIEATQELADNELLRQDYPEICIPIREAFSRPNRSKYLTVNGLPARMECTTTKLVFPTIEGMPGTNAGCVIEGSGLLEASRGLRHATPDGRTLRPELLIIDDFQTRQSAKSASQCYERLNIIQAGLKKMAAPDKALACIVNCTVIVSGDAADQLLDNETHPEFHGTRRAMVYEWPARQDLWDQYADLRKNGMRHGDDGQEATKFYRRNRKAMDAGGKVSWSHRKRPGELSALQCAYNIRIDDGEDAFQAECQNNPVRANQSQYEITPQIVLSRTNGFPRLHAPSDTIAIAAATDINYVGLNWVIGAATPTAAYVVAWGKTPSSASMVNRRTCTDIEAIKILQTELSGLIQLMNGVVVNCGDQARHIDLFSPDCGNWMDAVFQTCNSVRLPMRVVPIRGAPAQKYKASRDSRKFGEGWHLANWERRGQVVVINADLWKERAQRGFLVKPGAPGSVSLYKSDNPHEHRRYADELCGERLVEHVTTASGDYYQWARQPGAAWDLEDATAYMLALLSSLGMGGLSSGMLEKKKPVNVVISRPSQRR